MGLINMFLRKEDMMVRKFIILQKEKSFYICLIRF